MGTSYNAELGYGIPLETINHRETSVEPRFDEMTGQKFNKTIVTEQVVTKFKGTDVAVPEDRNDIDIDEFYDHCAIGLYGDRFFIGVEVISAGERDLDIPIAVEDLDAVTYKQELRKVLSQFLSEPEINAVLDKSGFYLYLTAY